MTLPDLTGLSLEDARLRWVASDVAAVEDAAARAERELAAAEGREVPRLLGYLGSAYSMLGRSDEAVAAHGRARALAAAAGNARAHAVALVRLGESYRCADRYDEAEQALRAALDLPAADVSHFALQHLGKTLLDRGEPAAAVTALAAALELRQASGDEELVRSSERALAAARGAA